MKTEKTDLIEWWIKTHRNETLENSQKYPNEQNILMNSGYLVCLDNLEEFLIKEKILKSD